MSNNAYTSGSDVANNPFAGLTLPAATDSTPQKPKSNKRRSKKPAGAMSARQLREAAKQAAAKPASAPMAPAAAPTPAAVPAQVKPSNASRRPTFTMEERAEYVGSLQAGQHFPEARVVEIVKNGLVIELEDGAAQTAFLHESNLGSGRRAEIEDDLQATGTATIGVQVKNLHAGGGTRADGKRQFPSIILRLDRAETDARQRERVNAHEVGQLVSGTPRELVENDRGVFGLALQVNGVRALLHISQVPGKEAELRRLLNQESVELRVTEVQQEKGRLGVTTEAVYQARENVLAKANTGEVVSAQLVKNQYGRSVSVGSAVKVNLAGEVLLLELGEHKLATTQNTVKVTVHKSDDGDVMVKLAPRKGSSK